MTTAIALTTRASGRTFAVSVKPLRIFIAAAWVAAFALALCADRPIATWVHGSTVETALTGNWKFLAQIVRLPGNFLSFTLLVAAGLFLQGRQWWRPAIFVLVSGILVFTNSLVKWIVGRARPFQGGVFTPHPFGGGITNIGGPNQSFPSGDVCLAAATAGALMILFPRGRVALWGVIGVVAIERIAAGAHYPSDTVAAAALGLLLARISWQLTGRPRVPIDKEEHHLNREF